MKRTYPYYEEDLDNEDFFEEEWDIDFEQGYYALRAENFRLREKLEASEKKHSDFVGKMAQASSNVTDAWVRELVKGNIKLNLSKDK